jgi:hypothetical protein
MNTGSPLTKDQKGKKITEEKIIKAKPKISLATTKKILKASKREIGTAEAFWLNTYIDNKVRGECLPLSLYSNDLPAELIKTYGSNAQVFIDKILLDFAIQMPNPLLASVHS